MRVTLRRMAFFKAQLAFRGMHAGEVVEIVDDEVPEWQHLIDRGWLLPMGDPFAPPAPPASTAAPPPSPEEEEAAAEDEVPSSEDVDTPPSGE